MPLLDSILLESFSIPSSLHHTETYVNLLCAGWPCSGHRRLESLWFVIFDQWCCVNISLVLFRSRSIGIFLRISICIWIVPTHTLLFNNVNRGSWTKGFVVMVVLFLPVHETGRKLLPWSCSSLTSPLVRSSFGGDGREEEKLAGRGRRRILLSLLRPLQIAVTSQQQKAIYGSLEHPQFLCPVFFQSIVSMPPLHWLTWTFHIEAPVPTPNSSPSFAHWASFISFRQTQAPLSPPLGAYCDSLTSETERRCPLQRRRRRPLRGTTTHQFFALHASCLSICFLWFRHLAWLFIMVDSSFRGRWWGDEVVTLGPSVLRCRLIWPATSQASPHGPVSAFKSALLPFGIQIYSFPVASGTCFPVSTMKFLIARCRL